MKRWFVLLACLVSGPAPRAQQPALAHPTNCSVQGQIIQQSGGLPIRKVAIELVSTGDDWRQETEYRGVTDAEGRFKLQGVKPGSYRIYFGTAGFVGAEKRHHGSGMLLVLEPGQEVKDLLFHMKPAATIVGKVRDEDGDPVSGADVMAIPYGIVPHGSALQSPLHSTGQCSTDDLGQCRLANLEPGRYLVAAQMPYIGSSEDMEPYLTTYYPGRTEENLAVPLDLRSGDELPISLTLTRGRTFHVRGQVSTLPGWTAKEPAELMLQPEESAGDWRFFSGVIDEHGAFDIKGVPPGSYTAWLTPTRARGLEALFDDKSPYTMRIDQSVHVTDGDVNDLRITPLAGGRIRGRLRMDDGRKQDWSDMILRFTSDSGRHGGAVVGSEDFSPLVKRDGSFATPLPALAGSYHVHLSRAGTVPEGYFVKRVTVGGKDVSDSGFTVAGGDVALDVVLSANSAALEGTAVDAQSNPAPDVQVFCIPNNSRRMRFDLYRKVTTDAHGHFRLQGVTPGEYEVLAIDTDIDEDDLKDTEFVRPPDWIGQTIDLNEGEHKKMDLKVLVPAD
jgi:protocatechuate 3,4-dioxygenase beta subunit